MKRLEDPAARELVHDFNNLLTAIIGAAEAILERSGIDRDTRADVEHIREGAHRGAELVRRHAGSNTAVILINETIRATSRLLSHRLGTDIALELDLRQPDHPASIEPSQLDRVLLNLINNARHAMPAGGTVTLSTEHRSLAVESVCVPDTIPAGDYVAITVTDTGIGIPGDDISRIFEPGFSSRPRDGGSGLGLSSVLEIVRQSHGFLTVESVEGRGTCVEIFLPRRAAAESPSAPTGMVLLVEDDKLVRQAAERILRRAGWTVRSVESAEDALEILEDSVCDLMISDIAMPGMDGLALTRLVLTTRPDLPVILTSGYPADAEETITGANVTFLTKPYGGANLLAAVSRVRLAAVQG
jgi:two-component system, cell cycle sensor histidine kinase and response regulator CckA